jgi:hypothetical protein
MTETRTQYLVPGHKDGPSDAALLPYDDPGYCQPSWQEVRAVIQQTGLTGAGVANLVGVGSRTVRKWVSPPDTSNHAPIPYAAWRLLLIAAGLVKPPTI